MTHYRRMLVQAVLTCLGVAMITMALITKLSGMSQILLIITGVGMLLAGVALGGNRGRHFVRRLFLSKLGLILGGVLVGLCAAEFGLRGLTMFLHLGDDANGFRNDSVPDRVDIVALGDSQTWGVNASPAQAWPQTLASISGRTVYNMSRGGYNPVQYGVQTAQAFSLSPKVLVVGFYFGNDLAESYEIVYETPSNAHADLRSSTGSSSAAWKALMGRVKALRTERREITHERPAAWLAWLQKHTALGRLQSTLGRFVHQQDWWSSEDAYRRGKTWAEAHPEHGVVYDNGKVRTVHTMAYRLLVQDLNEPPIAEGLRITQEMLRRIKAQTDAANVRLLILLIPTKEMVHADGMRTVKAQLDETYAQLVQMETLVRAAIVSLCENHGMHYVEALPGLARAVQRDEQIYPPTTDGHPNARGYFFIASAVQEALLKLGW